KLSPPPARQRGRLAGRLPQRQGWTATHATPQPRPHHTRWLLCTLQVSSRELLKICSGGAQFLRGWRPGIEEGSSTKNLEFWSPVSAVHDYEFPYLVRHG
ncbi:hypothetical protein LEMLEM_LOCUS20545, partial [Lemmus lemmus]